MTQKNALLAAVCTRSSASTACDVLQPVQSTIGFNTCMMANPPPPNGSMTFCAGNARTPNIMRRMSLNETSRKLGPTEEAVELGSKITVCAALRKIACSYATYRAVRRDLLGQGPPTIGS